MKTTVNLPDALLEAAKRRAHEQGRTFTSLLEEALHRVLEQDPGRDAPLALPSWGTGSGRTLVDLDDRDAVYGALDRDASWPR